MKQFINLMKTLIIALAIMFFVLPVVTIADTGTIDIINATTTSYTPPGSSSGYFGMNFDRLNFYNTSYNVIDGFKANLGTAITFGKSFESTPFTIYSGGTGSGYFWYDRNTTSVYYEFLDGTQITGTEIVLNFSSNITANITGIPNIYWDGKVSTVAEPVCINSEHVEKYCAMTDANKPAYTNVRVSSEATDTYNVSYLSGGLFSVSIDKNTLLSTKYFISSYDLLSLYSQESTFNTVDINNAIFTYDEGLALRVMLDNGWYEIVYLNESGTVQSTSSIYGAATIEFNQSNYSIGNNANITVNLTGSDFTNYQYSYALYDEKNEIVESFNLPSSFDGDETYTLSTSFDNGGTWRVRLNACVIGSCEIPYIMAYDYAYLPVNLDILESPGSDFITYSGKFLTSNTETLYNNSDIWIKYDIRFSMTDDNYSVKKDSLNYYVQIKDPNLVIVDSRKLNIACEQGQSTYWAIFDLILGNSNDWVCYADRLTTESYANSQAFYSDHPDDGWLNGTLTGYLIEDFRGSRKNLDILTWDVQNISGSTGIISDEALGGGKSSFERAVSGQPSTSGRVSIDNIFQFMELPIFWGLIFILGILYYLRMNTGLVLPVLFIIINIEAVVGLLDPYATYIVIMTWLVVAIFFIFVQRKTTG